MAASTIRAGGEDVFHLSAGEPVRHLRLVEIVHPRRAATDFRRRQIPQLEPGYHPQQPSRGGGDLLGVAQVTGVMVGGHLLDPSAGRNRAQGVEELVHVHHLGGELFAMRPQPVLPVLPVFLHHRPAAGVVDDDRVVAVQLERHQIGVGLLSGARLSPA